MDQRPLEQFRQSDFLPFQAGIDAGAGGVLVSHNIVTCLDPELPASLSPASYQVLREELGFEGVAMTDDLDMDAVQKYVEEGTAPVMALQAGADLVLTSDPQGGIPSVLEAVETGALTWDRLGSVGAAGAALEAPAGTAVPPRGGGCTNKLRFAEISASFRKKPPLRSRKSSL